MKITKESLNQWAEMEEALKVRAKEILCKLPLIQGKTPIILDVHGKFYMDELVVHYKCSGLDDEFEHYLQAPIKFFLDGE